MKQQKDGGNTLKNYCSRKKIKKMNEKKLNSHDKNNEDNNSIGTTEINRMDHIQQHEFAVNEGLC